MGSSGEANFIPARARTQRIILVTKRELSSQISPFYLSESHHMCISLVDIAKTVEHLQCKIIFTTESEVACSKKRKKLLLTAGSKTKHKYKTKTFLEAIGKYNYHKPNVICMNTNTFQSK